MSTLVGLFIVAYLPGALIYRLPTGDRAWRSARPAEERGFWGVLLSVLVSSVVALALAAAGLYTFARLASIDAGVALAILAWGRGRLRYDQDAPPPGWGALIPVALIGLGLWLYSPPAEYLMGGRDPGIYMHEGIQIAQRGSLVTTDAVAASVPRSSRDLFFPDLEQPGYYSSRFMAFFLKDPDAGTVVGQFPHLYPVWIAIGYGLDGLTGTRRMVGWWAIFGVLAVYFAGVRLVGRPGAAAGAALLTLNVVQVWYARYPNSEIVMQALLFGGLLAHAYAHERNDAGRGWFFAVVAALSIGILLFVRFPAVIAVAGVVGASLLMPGWSRRLALAFVVPLLTAVVLALVYYTTLLAPYFARPIAFVQSLEPLHLTLWSLGALGGAAVLWAVHRPTVAPMIRRGLPLGLIGGVAIGAVYTYFFREPGGRLAPQDAYAVRQFADFYITPIGLAAGVLGYGLVVRRSFWRNAGLVLVVTAFAAFYLYKMRIYPEHFWTARRFIPAIMPATLLFAAGAAFAPLSLAVGGANSWPRGRIALRLVPGLLLIGFLGWQFWAGTRPILAHVEYAGLIPQLERLVGDIGEDDLVIVEAREASDLHILALPFAYTYARNVLVMARAQPDLADFRAFLAWAKARYRRVLFMGGGGTPLSSRSTRGIPLAHERFRVPQYEVAYLAYPESVGAKAFNFGIYELRPQSSARAGLDLDVGAMDDLYVHRFHAKETHANGTTFRWSRNTSYVSLVGVTTTTRLLTIWMGDGGRPAAVGAARVTVTVDERELGTVTVTPGTQPYRFELPPELAAALATREDPGRLRLATRTWNPAEVLGVPDPRDIGVMIDRISLETVPHAP